MTKYCCDNYQDAIEGDYIGEAISLDGIYVNDSCGIVYPVSILYCPWCGKKL